MGNPETNARAAAPGRSSELGFWQKLRLLPITTAKGAASMTVMGLRRFFGTWQLERRKDDIFIAGYPGSGLSLAQMILYQLTTSGEMDIPHIESVAPVLERQVMLGNAAALNRLPTPRIFRTHLLHRHVPQHGRTLYVVRGIHEIVAKSYDKLCRSSDAPLSLSVFLRQFARSLPFTGSWFEHTASWWPHRLDEGVLLLTYEEMNADLEAAVFKIAGFCGISLDEETLQRVRERCGREFMARRAEKFDPRLRQFSLRRRDFIRKGRVGGWSETFSPERVALLDARLDAMARDLGNPCDAQAEILLRPAHTAGKEADLGPSDEGVREREPLVLRTALSLEKLLAGRYHGLRRKILLTTRFRPRDSDIYIVTYPRSGTTLMQMMLYQLSRGDLGFRHIDDVVPWLEQHADQGRLSRLEALDDEPRLFKSHLPYGLLPPGRYIYVARNVRDVAASAYHLYCASTGVDKDLDEFLDDFLSGKAFMLSWFEHIRSWWTHRGDGNVLFLTYEQVVADLPGAVRRVAAFCGFPLDFEREPEVIERCSFAFMKRHSDKFDSRLVQDSVRNGKKAVPRWEILCNPILNAKLSELASRLGPLDEEARNQLFGMPVQRAETVRQWPESLLRPPAKRGDRPELLQESRDEDLQHHDDVARVRDRGNRGRPHAAPQQ